MATNNILKFAGGAIVTNMLTDIEYAALYNAGHVPGIADNALENKALKQSSAISAGVAQFLADNQLIDIDDSLTPANISAYFDQSIDNIVDPKLPVQSTNSIQGKIELATSAEAQGLSDVDRAITPSTLNASQKGANQSLVANGFQKFAGGLIIAWGEASIAEGVFPTVVLYNASAGFTTVFAVYLTDTTNSVVIGNASVLKSLITNTQFQAVTDVVGQSDIVFWFAIGI